MFNYIGRNIELFYVRYLQILGLNTGLAYDDYDERHVPSRCQRPWTDQGEGVGDWTDRPCADKYFPDIAVPLEWVGGFTVVSGTNQSIWCDVYIPKNIPAGTYSGTLTVSQGDASSLQIPVSLQVRAFSLPDLPSAKTMLAYGQSDINYRYLGERWLEEDDPRYRQGLDITDRHFQMAHRHKISLIDSYTGPENMDDRWLARLDGSLFTADRGYDGVGVGAGVNVFSIGTYSSWPWEGQGRGGDVGQHRRLGGLVRFPIVERHGGVLPLPGRRVRRLRPDRAMGRLDGPEPGFRLTAALHGHHCLA